MQLIGFPIAFFFISAINGLVIRVALICSNIVLLPIMTVMNALGINADERSRIMIYHSMGLIGAQMAHYDSQGKSKFTFAVAVFCCLCVTYFIQTCAYFIWNRLTFPHIYPSALGDLYFGYLNLIEFTWFLFARTRLTLKYYPKVVTILNIAFLVYINSYEYAASVQFLMFIVLLNTLILVWFLKECELPAIRWNPFDENTPSLQRPRIGY
jgi:hypothetical protein